MTVVTAHQLNYLPGVSVMRKVAAADMVVWLDEVRFTQGGFINRNRLQDGTWLTVPIDRSTMRGPIKDVEIADYNGWQRKHARTLREHFAKAEHFSRGAPTIDVIENAWRLADQKLITLNAAAMDQMCAALELETAHIRQSDLVAEGASISEKLADIVGLMGGDTYLSGPSGHRYLDLAPFRERKIRVEFFNHAGPNPTALDAILTRGALP